MVPRCACLGPRHPPYSYYYCRALVGTTFNVFSYDSVCAAMYLTPPFRRCADTLRVMPRTRVFCTSLSSAFRLLIYLFISSKILFVVQMQIRKPAFLLLITLIINTFKESTVNKQWLSYRKAGLYTYSIYLQSAVIFPF